MTPGVSVVYDHLEGGGGDLGDIHIGHYNKIIIIMKDK